MFSSRLIFPLINGPIVAWAKPAFDDASTGFPANWCLRNERRNSILMTRHYPDPGCASDWLNWISYVARPIRSNAQIWIVTCYQCGISAPVTPTLFSGESSGFGCFLRLESMVTLPFQYYSETVYVIEVDRVVNLGHIVMQMRLAFHTSPCIIGAMMVNIRGHKWTFFVWTRILYLVSDRN